MVEGFSDRPAIIHNIHLITTYILPSRTLKKMFKGKFHSDDYIYLLPENILPKDTNVEFYQCYINHYHQQYLYSSNDSICRIIEEAEAENIVVIAALEPSSREKFFQFIKMEFPWKITRRTDIWLDESIKQEKCYILETSIGMKERITREEKIIETFPILPTFPRKVMDIDLNSDFRTSLTFETE
jgi:hypothetical protein